jgi:hypothetical protein
MTDRNGSWIADALRFHGLEPDPLHFPGRKPPSLSSGGNGAFLWVYTRGEQRFEFAWPRRNLTNADVSSMLFRAGVRVEIPEQDLNGEAHPRLVGTELDDSGAVSSIVDGTEPAHSAHLDTREAG